MKRALSLAVSLIMMFLPVLFSEAEEETGIVAKVTTVNRGPLKLRAKENRKSRVLTEIPNGTCVLVAQEGEKWCRVIWQDREGYCMTEFLTLLQDADLSILEYRVLKTGDKGEDVLALKKRMKELGYLRSTARLTDIYTDVTAERVILFQRQTGMPEDGIASQELQACLFSDKAPSCTQALPRVRSRVSSGNSPNHVICGCCMGEGCECCGYKGWTEEY